MGGSDLSWYFAMYSGDRFPMETYLVGAEGSDRESVSGYKVSSLVGFSLGGPGSEVRYM